MFINALRVRRELKLILLMIQRFNKVGEDLENGALGGLKEP